MSGSESSLLCYLGWLYNTEPVSSTSVRNYLPAVVTSDTRIGKTLSLSPLLQLAVSAYQQADTERWALQHPEILKERRAIPSSVACNILKAALLAPDTDITFLQNAAAFLPKFGFFELGEAGASLLLEKISVTSEAIHIAIARRKHKS